MPDTCDPRNRYTAVLEEWSPAAGKGIDDFLLALQRANHPPTLDGSQAPPDVSFVERAAHRRSVFSRDCVPGSLEHDDAVAYLDEIVDCAKRASFTEGELSQKQSAEAARDRRAAISTDPADVLREFNAVHAVVPFGARAVITRDHVDPVTGFIETDFLRKPDFQLLYENRQVKIQTEDGPKFVPAAQWWLSSGQRRQYEGIIFDPSSAADSSRFFNLWHGMAVKPEPGDWSIFREHIKKNICGGNDEYFQYLMAWMADAAQNPATRPGVAVVLRGEMGTGKGTFAANFGAIFGRHYRQVNQVRHFLGNFNAHLHDCLIMFVDEGFWAGDKQAEAVLKGEITETKRMIEHKGFDAKQIENYTRYIIASNSEWTTPMGMADRRFFVLDVGEEKIQDTEFFEALRKQMASGGREALLYDLLAHDLSGINLRNIPQTQGALEQKIHSFDPITSWWFEKLQSGKLPAVNEYSEDWPEWVPKEIIYSDFVNESERTKIKHRSWQTQFAILLKKLCKKISNEKRIASIKNRDGVKIDARVYGFVFPDLNECRREFSEKMRDKCGFIKWNRDDEDLGAGCSELFDNDRVDSKKLETDETIF
jgi:hypothetical protein